METKTSGQQVKKLLLEMFDSKTSQDWEAVYADVFSEPRNGVLRIKVADLPTLEEIYNHCRSCGIDTSSVIIKVIGDNLTIEITNMEKDFLLEFN